MKNSDNDTFDRLIVEVLKEELEKTPSPILTSEEAWEQLRKRQGSNQTRTKKKVYNQKLLYVAALFVLSIVFSPQSGSAYSFLANFFQKVQGTVAHMFVKVGEEPGANNNAPKTDEFTIVGESEVVSEQVPLDVAQKETAFDIKVPTEIPSEFKLANVTISKTDSEQSMDIFLNFEAQDRVFTINEKLLGDSFGSGISVDTDDTNVEKIMIQEYAANLVLYKNGHQELFWVDENNIYYSISGNLSKEEFMMIAESM